MCTLTWRELPDGGYEAFFNRDELKTRQRAQPPQRLQLLGTAVLAPIDADAGGTWISVNEHGVGLALLNHYQGSVVPPPRGEFVSRGLLVRDLAHHGDLDDAVAALRAMPHANYQPFRLLLLAFRRPPLLVTWDGVELSSDPQPDLPVISSGLDIEAATRNRRAQYRKIIARDGVSGESLLAFHRSHEPEPSPISVCMHREWSHTVSLTRLKIGARDVSLAYADGSPCGAPLGDALQLQPATADA